MVKGTNKMIIEIFDTQSKYFEKVIFFVKENHSNSSSKYLNLQANKYLKKVEENNSNSYIKKRYIDIAKILMYIGIGSILSVIFMNIR